VESESLITKKSLGQHWLKDEESLKAIVKAANVKKEDTIL
jgi:16S rRNA A1518/A1519 N6-dimethyltransferase RsmA/KsgA/DIM1 with predicted DNA glycosylase/AP lyase activity